MLMGKGLQFGNKWNSVVTIDYPSIKYPAPLDTLGSCALLGCFDKDFDVRRCSKCFNHTYTKLRRSNPHWRNEVLRSERPHPDCWICSYHKDVRTLVDASIREKLPD